MREIVRKLYPATPLNDKELKDVEQTWWATSKGIWHIQGDNYRIYTDFVPGAFVISEGDRGLDIDHHDAFWVCQAHNEHIPRLLATIEAEKNENALLRAENLLMRRCSEALYIGWLEEPYEKLDSLIGELKTVLDANTVETFRERLIALERIANMAKSYIGAMTDELSDDVDRATKRQALIVALDSLNIVIPSSID